jgi:hypothetical protein
MGASGSAWIKHKKQTNLRADAVMDIPHPRFVRSGQRYFPVAGARARSRVPMQVIRVIEPLCELKRDDADGGTVRLRTARLLEVDGEGNGRYYRFLGYAAKAAYQTHAVVIEVAEPWARVICPEWHPGLAVSVAAAMLPQRFRKRGAWLSCRADLSADAPARVRPHGFAPPDGIFDPACYGPVQPPPSRSTAESPSAAELGPGCGDVVVFLSERELERTITGQSGLYLTGHPPPVRPGGRIYVHAAGRIHGWRVLGALRRLPNGIRLVLEPTWHPVMVDAAPSRPSSGVHRGEHGQQLWVWRSWTRDAESVESGPATAC